MRLNKLFIVLSFCIIFAIAKEPINLNFNDLSIDNFIKITSKIMQKNILLTSSIKGKVEFISNKPIYKEDLMKILIYTLETKGYTLVENEDIVRIVKLSEAAKYNTPVYNNVKDLQSYKMVTEIFDIKNMNVDYISSKIRHLLSKNSKLVTDKQTNTIVVTDFVANINTIKKIINILTQSNQKIIEIVELKNLQATAILSELKNIAKTVFNEKVLKQKVSILVNKDTNSIMFVGLKQNVNFLKKYLIDMDNKGSLVEKTVDVVDLKNAEAKNILKIITGLIGQKTYKDKHNKPFASIEEESNSIILMGPKEEVVYFKKLIEKLDIQRQQVYVQARIIEVSQTRTANMGIKYGIEGLTSSSEGVFNFAGNFGGTSMALSTATQANIDIPNVTDGLILGASINLMKQNMALDVVSEPSILCTNNKESTIYVGRTVSILDTTAGTGDNAKNSYKREDIGLKLKVKPRISSGNKVTLDLSVILEDVDNEQGANGQPNTSKKQIDTTAIVNNGENVILGGLVKNKISSTKDKVPFFGDIPLLGTLFRNTTSLNDKINLVVIITPYIVPKSKDLTYIRNQLAQLKILEDKFTKDTKLRLEKLKLNAKKEDLKREQEKLKLKEDTQDLKEDMLDFSYEKKDYEDEVQEQKKEPLTDEEKLHQQRIKEMFGI